MTTTPAPHATARLSNVKATLFVHLKTLAVTGSPQWLFEGMQRARSDKSRAWLRVHVTDVTETLAGHFSATFRASRADILVAVDVFYPDGGEAGTHDIYQLDRMAEDVADIFRRTSLSINSYTDPDSPVAISGAALRFGLPDTRSLPTADGYARRQVVTAGHWFLRDAA